MQGGVIGGICLLAFLLSVGLADDIGKHSGETELKSVELLIEENIRRSNNDVKSLNEVHDDLKSDVAASVPDTNSVPNDAKSSTEVKNAPSNLKDNSSSQESLSSRNVSTESGTEPTQMKERMSPQVFQSINSKPNERALPDIQKQTSSENDSLKRQNTDVQSSTFLSDSQDNKTFYPVSSDKNVDQNTAHFGNEPISSKEIISARSPLEISSPGERTSDINKPVINSNIAPLYSSQNEPSHVVIPPGISNHNTPADGLRYNPSFLPVYPNGVGKITNNLFPDSGPGFSGPNGYPALYPTNNINRRDSSDAIQTRNAEDSNSDTVNSYPYSGSRNINATPDNISPELRSGDPYNNELSYPYVNSAASAANSAQASANAHVSGDDLTAQNQGMNPYSYGYPQAPVVSSSLASASANAQSAASAISKSKSRIIWPHEYIFPNKIHGSENVIQCTRENELHHYSSQIFDCLVCICLNEYGLLEPVCASCAGCQKPAPPEPPIFIPVQPTPEPFVPILVPDPYVPLPISEPNPPSASAPSMMIEPTFVRDVDTTTPVPREVPPPEVTTLPPIADIPVPMPLPQCEKFPPHVTFPHPTDACKKCKCSVELSAAGVPEQQITCYHDTTCAKTEPPEVLQTPPPPPIPIPVELFPGPFPQPAVEPVPEHYPVPSPPPTNSLVEATDEPLPWPPVSTPPPPPIPLLPKKGPLPGPSPHDSCRPYPPNQPFQHPWDDCQVCQCSESTGIGVVNVEISCFTKLSCCVESPDQAITVTAIAEASSNENGDDGQVLAQALFNSHLSSTPKPNLIDTNNVVISNDESNAMAQSTSNSASFVPSSYQSVNTVSNANGAQTLAQASSEYISSSAPSSSVSSFNTEHQAQAYAEANVAQNSMYNPTPSFPAPPQPENAYGTVVSGSQSSAEVDHKKILTPYDLYPIQELMNPGNGQTQSSAEFKANAQNAINNGVYSPNGLFPKVNTGSITSSSSSEEKDEYISAPVIYPPPPSYPPYMSGISQSQSYAEANAQYNRPMSTTYKPPVLYPQYTPEVSQSQVYGEAVVHHNDYITSTQKPPTPFGQYNAGASQNQAFVATNTQYSHKMTTQTPQILYNPYNPDIYQNQAFSQANGQYGGTVTSTQKPVFYGQYNPNVAQNHAYSASNALYSEGPAYNEPQSLQPLNPYSPGVSQNLAYAGANSAAQNSLTNPGYYLSGSYQATNALSGVSNSDQTAVAESLAQSQDFTPYQPGPPVGSNKIPNPSSGYPYQPSYYTGYSQYPPYPGRPDQGLDSYKANQMKYVGNYEFNGQGDGISVLNPQSGYYPYSPGPYSPTKPAANLYSSQYAKYNNYDMNSLYRPEQYGGSSAKSAAQAYANTKMQIKSGAAGLQEDSNESKVN